MLELFIKSKIRQRLILLFIYNQKKEFYLSEIARMVNTTAGTAQRELNRLLRSDFIVFKKKAGLNLYVLNKDYSLLGEVESIVKKTFGIEVELKKDLNKIKGVGFAFIFGSYVKGNFKSDSDIDLYVIGEVDGNRVFKVVQKLEKIIGRDINYHISSKREFLKQKKDSYFCRDIIDNYILLAGEECDFRKFIK